MRKRFNQPIAGESGSDITKPVKLYPRPDYLHFCKSTAGMAAFLVFLHWVPDLSTWIHANIFGEQLAINERRFNIVLMVAYAMGGFAFVIGIAGLAWASWHLPKREAYDRERKCRMEQELSVEITERLAEKNGNHG